MVDSLIAELKRRNVFKVGLTYLVLAWLVIQITSVAVPALQLPVWVNSLVFYLGLIGFPFALLFAWAFELTPDGVMLESKIPLGESITTDTSRKLDYITIVLLLLTSCYFFWESRYRDSYNQIISPAVETPAALRPLLVKNRVSLAVLPFKTTSPADSQVIYTGGLSKDIAAAIGSIKGLKLVPVSPQLQGINDPLELFEQLDAGYLIRGTVNQQDNRMISSVELLQVNTEKPLWSDTFDISLSIENLHRVQNDIANAVIKSLSKKLQVPEQTRVSVYQGTDNLQAYLGFLRARQLYDAQLAPQQAVALLSEAIELDPDFARAHELKAALYSVQLESKTDLRVIETMESLALESAQTALAIEPDSAIALAVMARVKLNKVVTQRAQFKLTNILADLNRSLEINPGDPQALNWRGLTLLHVGRFSMALKDFTSCRQSSPYDAACTQNIIRLLSIMNYDGAAMVEYKKALNRGIDIVPYSNFSLLARLREETAFKVAANHPDLLAGWQRHDELYEAYLNPSSDHTELVNDILQQLSSKPGFKLPQRLRTLLSPIAAKLIAPDHLTVWDPLLEDYRQTDDFNNFIISTGVLTYWQHHGYPLHCRPQDDHQFTCK